MSTSKSRQTNRKKTIKIKSDAPRPRIEPGTYEAVCYDAVIKPGYHGQPTVYVNFRIHGGRYNDTELFMTCPAIHKRPRQRHKLYTQWALSIGRKPAGKEPFVPEVFVSKLYRIKVRDTRILQSDSSDLLPDYLQYSVVDTIIETLTGVAVSR